ncbi:methyltransferase domain-containing protein [Flammeovirga sp. OC4]|uniref:methyltransferase domain-containing protein n=1 Tax=Flammeovirga sp. OC4 TaxID=1382345 RepID=UPI0005C4CBF2|nr:methyltransferase domain-containing protein [Flammeovirga sp. OC4]
MINLETRSKELELLDQPQIPTPDLYQNLKELHFINTYLGGYQVVFEGIKKILQNTSKGQKVRILDIGSGGGDTLKAIYQHFKSDYQLELVGVDLKEDCIQYASENCKALPIRFVQSDYRDYLSEGNSFDLIICSLFCHHLPSEDLSELFFKINKNALKGCIMNDLHRHFLAYYSIKWLTKAFSKSYLVKNDACLSVARSFSKKDIQNIMNNAQITNYKLYWKWAFRWLLIF